jgi:hypothetical protein
MTGQGHVHLAQPRFDDGVEHGGQGIGLEVLHLAVQPAQDLGRIRGFQRVGAQRAAHPPMITAAARPDPATSPTVTHSSPDGRLKTSSPVPPIAPLPGT